MADSGTAIRTSLDRPVYSTSAPLDDNDFWIQAPLAAQQFDTSERFLIDGIYSQPKEPYPLVDMELAREFAAWEAASDEALLNFERDLH